MLIENNTSRNAFLDDALNDDSCDNTMILRAYKELCDDVS